MRYRWMVGMMLGIWSLVPGADPAPDVAREQRLADEISDAIMDGEALYLKAAEHEFLAIYTTTAAQPARGAVLLLHGRGYHPDWPELIHPLRVGLPQHGWNTLSIQLPVLDKDAKYIDYLPLFPAAVPRIEAAIAFLREQGNGRVVILAHSCGAHMAQHWINARGAAATAQFDGFIGIGMGATDYRQPMQETYALDRIKAPVLDLYAEQDFPAVQRMAPQRLALLQQAGNPWSRQMVVPGADHYFTGYGAELLEAVADWLAGL
ncbi:MAG: hypothetical protein RLZ44_354 [Pseudomonadota bacterium]